MVPGSTGFPVCLMISFMAFLFDPNSFVPSEENLLESETNVNSGESNAQPGSACRRFGGPGQEGG
jgi:hypothetical protein